MTPSTQQKLFPILICLFLIPKEIPFREPIFNGNFCEPGRARFAEKKMEFPSQVVSKKYSTLFSAKFGPFRTRSGAVCRPCTINVRNEPVQEMFCVVKCETPPVLRWKLCEFQDRKSISISGINLIVWRGLGRFHLIILEIGISSSGRMILELMLPFNHLYQATSGLGFLQFLVGTFQLPGSRKICISFGHLEVEIGKTES